uniref:Uncharacterized protein n=1 Tax=Rhizophora mucronata TaxID=61149 RepID=A0A2P2QSD8_RHIMU
MILHGLIKLHIPKTIRASPYNLFYL